MMIKNPFNSHQGVFTLPNEFARSQMKRLVFGPKQWCDLTIWIAAETMKNPTFDLEALMKKCSHEDIDIRNMAIREWSRRIANALIKKDAYGQFMLGEENYNGPKICEKTRKTILNIDLTQIILEHRVKVQIWFDKHLQQKKHMKPVILYDKRKIVVEHELIIEDNANLDNWEDLED